MDQTPQSFAAKLGIKQLPITWSGTVFYAKAKSGPSLLTTEEIHGNVSEDGKWVNDLTFSVSNTNSYFMIVLKNVPLGTSGNLNTQFQQSGSDIRKFVSSITYILNASGSVQQPTQFVSPDWNNTAPGFVPTLIISFDKGSGVPRGAFSAPSCEAPAKPLNLA